VQVEVGVSVEANNRSACRLAPVMFAAAMLVFLSGCSSLSLPKLAWPFGAKPAPAPQPVDEIVFDAADGATAPTYPQYWKRNTLVVDLQAAPSSGRVTMRPRAAGGWPVRLAFRVSPGAIGQLDVQAAQRVVLPVNAGATPPLDLELAPSVYQRDTPAIVVSWGQSPPAPGT
jgi:hypothetical protein